MNPTVAAMLERYKPTGAGSMDDEDNNGEVITTDALNTVPAAPAPISNMPPPSLALPNPSSGRGKDKTNQANAAPTPPPISATPLPSLSSLPSYPTSIPPSATSSNSAFTGMSKSGNSSVGGGSNNNGSSSFTAVVKQTPAQQRVPSPVPMHMTALPAVAVPSSSTITVTPPPIAATIPIRVHALKYKRIGLNSWTVSEYVIFDLLTWLTDTRRKEALVQQQAGVGTAAASTIGGQRLYLVDNAPASSSQLVSPNTIYRYDSSSGGGMLGMSGNLLRSAMEKERVLVAEWSVDDPQLDVFLTMVQRSSSPMDLISIYHQPIGATTVARKKAKLDETSTPSGYAWDDVEGNVCGPVRGCLAFEVDMRMILCVRQALLSPENEKTGKKERREDVWCHVYQEDFLPQTSEQTLGEFLVDLFPQLYLCYPSSVFAHHLVKYRASSLGEGSVVPDFDTNNVPNGNVMMETLGCLNKPLKDIVSKLSSAQVCHNLVIENMLA